MKKIVYQWLFFIIMGTGLLLFFSAVGAIAPPENLREIRPLAASETWRLFCGMGLIITAGMMAIFKK